MPNISILILFSLTLLISPSAALDISIGGGSIIIGGASPPTTTTPAPDQSPADCSPPPPPPPCPPTPPSPPIIHHSPSPPPPPTPRRSPSPPPPPTPRRSPSPPPPPTPRRSPSPPPPPPKPLQPPPSHPPPSPSPPPQVPAPGLNDRLVRDFNVIQRFKRQIQKNVRENDPNNITATWTGGNPCNFRGFICSHNPLHREQTLSDVQFNGFNFGGVQLTDFIDKLLDVSIFHANTNRFFGRVPAITSSTLPFLFELDLSNNLLTGAFPTTVLKATNLTFLDLRFNTFAGVVDPHVFSLDVDVLFINNNKFQQNLPPQLGSTPALYLTFANNLFTGPIPTSIGQTRKTLLEVLFLNNKLTGCLPWQIGLLSRTRVFDASDNSLQGNIPASFACLKNMKILRFKNNKLDGVVPESLCALPCLQNLTLSYNYFTEVGPKCRDLIERKVLDITGNCISGLGGQRDPKVCNEFFKSHPRGICSSENLNYAPCKAAEHGNAGKVNGRRRAAEVAGPVWAATYGALEAV